MTCLTFKHSNIAEKIQTCNFQKEMLEWLDDGNHDLPCCKSGRENAIGRHINSDLTVVDELISIEGGHILFFVIPHPGFMVIINRGMVLSSFGTFCCQSCIQLFFGANSFEAIKSQHNDFYSPTVKN